MIESLFDRTAELTFGMKGVLGRSYTDLRLVFKIEKSISPQPNKATIQVYNLTKDSRGMAEQQGVLVFLKAGYGGQNEGLFVGNAARVLSREEGTEIITEFECGDGEKEYQESTLDQSFAPGTPVNVVFESLAQALKVTRGQMLGIKPETYLNGLTLSGSVRDHLDMLTAKQDLEWSIQDGALQITPRDVPTLDTAVLLTPSTGLIGTPRKKDKGLEIVSLLQPGIRPGRLIAVESDFIKGVFRCLRVVHQGDTHGKEWYSTVEVPA
jgi:hypothetical protein